MQFDLKSSNGKSGEYYFAYWISRYFMWPCRLLDIDVGIDAQLEIFDDNKHSTGDFIGVQIKTTMDGNPNVAVSLKNLEYWKSIEDVVILASICLDSNTPTIYWKRINDELNSKYIDQAKANESETTTITFEDKDLLVESHKDTFIRLPYEKNIKILNEAVGSIKRLCDEINSEIWCGEDDCYSLGSLPGFDYGSIESYLVKFDAVCRRYDVVNAIVQDMPKIDKLVPGLAKIDDPYNLLIANMKKFIGLVYRIDGDHDYEIGKRWKTSESHKTVLKIFEANYPGY